MKTTTRRRFVATSGALALQPFLPRASGEELPRWIDSHVHVWDADRETYPVSANFRKTAIKPSVFTPADLEKEQKSTGVSRTVLIQMSFFEFDNSYMLDVIAADPKRFRGVAIVDESKADVAETMKKLAEQGVRGFRLYAFPDRVKEWEGSKGIQQMWKTGGEENLAICCLTDPLSLPVIDRMAERYPKTRVVIDHFARIGMGGNIDSQQLDQLVALARFPEVYVKTSAFYALGKKAPPYTDLAPMIRELRDAFGSDRLMWGSDCPYQVQNEHTYRASVDLVTDKLPFLKETEIDDLMRNTAEKVFFG